MAKTTDRQIVNGQEYMLMDTEAREAINELREEIGPLVPIKPDYTQSVVYNPNNGYEGMTYPAGDMYGYGSCYFDVQNYRGQTVKIIGTEIGWVMQFSGTIGPSTIVKKESAEKSEEFSVLIDSQTLYLTVNEFGSISKEGIKVPDGYVTNEELEDEIDSLYHGEDPYQVDSVVRNPNPGSEGLTYPAGQGYGNGSAIFDVESFRNQPVVLNGTAMGYMMQFSGAPDPSTYVGGKVDINQRNKFEFTILPTAKYLTINVFGDKNSIFLKTNNDFATRGDLFNAVPYEKIYVAIGDSITNGSGASTPANRYSYKVARALIENGAANNSFNLGSGGSNSEQIAGFCGALDVVTTADCTIPSGITPVQIALSMRISDSSGGIGNRINPCYLNGIEGTIAPTNNPLVYTFTRSESGIEKFTPAGTKLVAIAAKMSLSAEIMTIFVGTNDAVDSRPEYFEKSLDNIRKLTKLSKNGKYLVLSPYTNSTGAEYRKALAEEYGVRNIDLFLYMSEEGVLDAIAEGLLDSGSQDDWRELLTTDGTHPNDIGHQLIYERIIERMTALGFMK